MGIEAEILPFPSEFGTASSSLPEKFKVLALADEKHMGLLEAVVKSIPMVDITIARPETPYDINEYTVGVQLTEYPRLLLNSQKMIMNGRHMISTVQEPYSGFIDTSDVTKFKAEMISRLLAIEKDRKMNTEAAEYYMATTDKEEFARKVKSVCAPVLEVLA
jgi:hypothetical protein